jgi:hypothetical protein
MMRAICRGEMDIYRSTEGNRWYRGESDKWEMLQPDGTWHKLGGKTQLGSVRGSTCLFRFERGNRHWLVEVTKQG